MGSSSDWETLQPRCRHPRRVRRRLMTSEWYRLTACLTTCSSFAEQCRGTGPAGHHRRGRRCGAPAGDAGGQDHRAGPWRASGQQASRRASTRSTRSCRCPRACRWPPSPSAPAGCSQCGAVRGGHACPARRSRPAPAPGWTSGPARLRRRSAMTLDLKMNAGRPQGRRFAADAAAWLPGATRRWACWAVASWAACSCMPRRCTAIASPCSSPMPASPAGAAAEHPPAVPPIPTSRQPWRELAQQLRGRDHRVRERARRGAASDWPPFCTVSPPAAAVEICQHRAREKAVLRWPPACPAHRTRCSTALELAASRRPGHLRWPRSCRAS